MKWSNQFGCKQRVENMIMIVFWTGSCTKCKNMHSHLKANRNFIKHSVGNKWHHFCLLVRVHESSGCMRLIWFSQSTWHWKRHVIHKSINLKFLSDCSTLQFWIWTLTSMLRANWISIYVTAKIWPSIYLINYLRKKYAFIVRSWQKHWNSIKRVLMIKEAISPGWRKKDPVNARI